MSFQQLEGDTVTIVSGGVYKVADLYMRHGVLYAAVAGGFVRLKADGSTSKPQYRIDTMDTDLALYRHPLGYLGTQAMRGPRIQPVAAPDRDKLLLPPEAKEDTDEDNH